MGTTDGSSSELRQAQEALREREAQLQALADAMPALMSYVDHETRYRFINRLYESWFNRPRESVIGKTMAEVLGPGLMEQAGPYIDRALRGEEVHFEVEAPYQRGRRWVDAHYIPHVDPSGQVLGFCIMVSDVTDRKRAEEVARESEARLLAVLDHLSVGVGLIDVDGRMALANSMMRGLVPHLIPSRDPSRRDRWRASDAAGRPVPRDQWPGARALRGETVRPGVEFKYRADDGRDLWLLTSAVPFRDARGEITGAIVVVQDITAHKEAHQALQAADRRKDEFLATLAHELRNPLAPIRNAVQVLKVKGSSDPDAQWVPELVDRQLEHMSRLLEDLLDVSRIAHDKLELRRQRVELAEVVRTAIETCRPHLDGAGHQLSVTLPVGPVHLDADPVRLAQVFSNLLTNAAKYTHAGGHIRLGAELRDGELAVSVRDDGIGISPEMLPRVFEIFSQGQEVLERSRGGLGLGLSLVRGLLELHGGRVEARSDGAGRGSEFVVYLPVLADGAPARGGGAAGVGPDVGPARRRMLIVDDMRDNADSLALVMRMQGHDVQTAYGGEEAIVRAAQWRPEVVVLDIGMPRPNGLDVCRHLRAQPWGQAMVLVALTGWGREDDRRRTEAAGFDHHLVKPTDPAALAALIASTAAR
jgi:PAS domain S-box-containing protein